MPENMTNRRRQDTGDAALASDAPSFVNRALESTNVAFDQVCGHVCVFVG
jgi:hypothetical protein